MEAIGDQQGQAERVELTYHRPRDAHPALEVALVRPVAEGDRLLVHAGTAIANLERVRPDRNLDRTSFNDRAASLRVYSGYWIFCSDSEFRGDCRTFGPGDYASLPGMNNVIS